MLAGENTFQPAAFKADAMSHEKFSLSLSPAPYHTLADCGAKEPTSEASVSCCALVSLRGSILACKRVSSRFAAAACSLAIDVALFASAIACLASSWYFINASSLRLPAFHENIQPSDITRATVATSIKKAIFILWPIVSDLAPHFSAVQGTHRLVFVAADFL